MDENTRDLLINLNRTFYQTFAQQFSATRQRLQPGVERILETISAQEAILDLGCGNGWFGKALVERDHQGAYTGLDSNPDLLRIADENLPANKRIKLIKRDLSSAEWDEDLLENQYDLITAFAVLHHFPDHQLRKRIITKIARLSRPGGRFIHSEWQFLNSPRLRERIQPWESIGVDPNLLEEGDYLVDWRSGGLGLRYIHVFGLNELDSLAAECGFFIRDSYSSDGEGGDLAVYQIWERV
jgi:tRNA (uracil-5-)-methyltransferase TRM9